MSLRWLSNVVYSFKSYAVIWLTALPIAVLLRYYVISRRIHVMIPFVRPLHFYPLRIFVFWIIVVFAAAITLVRLIAGPPLSNG
jgi:hypothetical protein